MRQLILLIVYLLSISLSLAQTTTKNLEKYWHYRERLTHYFVKVGPRVGESVVAYVRNKNRSSEKGFTVSDQTIDLAWYIGILATEYQLLSIEKQDTKATLQELYYAIHAFERLDRCEKDLPWNRDSSSLDGFFHRYDIQLYKNPHLFSIEGRNYHLKPTDTWGTKPPGMPTYISGFDKGNGEHNYHSAEESQDQVVHLLMGFYLVKKCLPDTLLSFYDIHHQKIEYNFRQASINNVDRMLSYFIKNKKAWIIKTPDGKNVERGANVLMYAYPISIIGARITKKSYTTFWSQWWLTKFLWDVSRIPNWVNDYNSTMALTLAALSDSWHDILPFSRVNNTGYYIKQCGKVWHRDIFYQLLYQFINNKNSSSYCQDQTVETINAAPFNGPYYWSQDSVQFSCCGKVLGKAQNGWAYPNKFRGTKKEQNAEVSSPYIGNFSGIDYMLLYNLYQLKEHSISYRKP